MRKQIFLLTMSVGLSACTASKFQTNKAALLKSSAVFPSTGGGEEYGSETPAGGGSGDPVVGAAVQVGGTSADVHPLRFMCSNSRSDGGNLANSSSLHVEVNNSDGVEVCKFISHSLRQAILSHHGVPHSALQAGCGAKLPNGGEVILLSDKGGRIGEFSYRPDRDDLDIADLLANGFEDKGQGTIVADFNPEDPPAGVQMTISRSQCDSIASPLVVRLGAQDVPLSLTSQTQGILFDILGKFSEPAPHTPKKISWFTDDSHALIALPDARGEVHGIDQLFGDNTTGPDSKGAANGYAALAKHDADRDGLISSADPVFAHLRLWIDRNRDGRSSIDELVTLGGQQIESIDLSYDSSYLERDQHGNETRMKSAVQLNDGSLRLMFDLWFSYRN